MNAPEPAGSLMIPVGQFLSVGENENIHSALKKFNQSLHEGGPWRGHRLLVALNDKGDPTGVLTLKSILNAVGLRLLEQDPQFKAECFSWYYIKKMRENGKVTVREVMRPLAMFSIDCRSPVSEAVKIFVRHGINYLPVSDGKKTVGIISRRELFFRYYELNGFRPENESFTIIGRIRKKLFKEPATI